MASHTNSPSSTGISVRLSVDGKNWKDWSKQLSNYAAADNASGILDGNSCPQFKDTDSQYNIIALYTPNIPSGATAKAIEAEVTRVGKMNKTIRPLNEDARQRKKEDEQAHLQWVARDARLQNTILSSIDKALVAQVRTSSSAHDMYLILKDLNSMSDHSNAARAWSTFLDLRAENCRTVREYIGKFREAINDLIVQGIAIDWVKPNQLLASHNSHIDELMCITMLHGLSKVLPLWVEARNNDLRQGKTWSIDTLIASLEDHIRNTPEEPVKTFTTIAKQQEEKRVRDRLNRSTPLATQATTLPLQSKAAQSDGTRPAKQTSLCTHCNKEHIGGTEQCWKAHPELMPEYIKKRMAAKSAAQTNFSHTDTSSDHLHGVTFTTTLASASLIQKAIVNKDYKQRYCYDTAANRHVFNDRKKFITYTPISENSVRGSTGQTFATGVGTIHLQAVKHDGTTQHISLNNVLHCPDFATNVISQAPFKRKGAWYHSGKDTLYSSDNQELAYLPEIDGIPNFLVVSNPEQVSDALAYASLMAFRSSVDEPKVARPMVDWHHIYGHAGIEAIKQTAKTVKGMEINHSTLVNCETCGLSKSKQNISRLPQTPPTRILGKVHVDIVGPISTPGIAGEKYWMLRTDGKSRRQWITTSDSRAALGEELIKWCKQMKTLTGLTVQTIFCDNAREFLNKRNLAYFDSEGTTVITSPPYDASRNGIAERANGLETTRVRSALIAAKLPKALWPFAASYMVRLHNVTSCSVLPGMITPMEAWNRDVGWPNPVPNVAHLQAFGHTGYVHIPEASRTKGDKFEARAVIGRFMGLNGEHIYLMWIPDTNDIIKTASVKFDKYVDDYHTLTPPTAPTIAPTNPPLAPLVERLQIVSQPSIQQPQTEQNGILDNSDDDNDHILPQPGLPQEFDGLPDDLPITQGNNTAARRQEIDGNLNIANILDNKRTRRPRVYFTSDTFDRCFAMALIKPTVGSKLSELPPEPRNWKEFLKHPRKKDLQLAMDDEYSALISNQTWRPATPEEQSTHEIIPAQWVWSYKGDAQGIHIKDKARLVACGNRQQQSIWYKEVYSYVVRTTTIRVLLALVAYFDLECEQIDMITAYLNAHLADDDVVLLRLPPGCLGTRTVVRLRRGMYGLRQSALLWYNDLKASLKDLGFEPIEADPCVFVNATSGSIIVVYVDDLILITKDKPTMTQLKKHLFRRYKARDLGHIGFYLGIRVLRNRLNRSISLTMDSYVDRVVEDYHLSDSASADTPLPKSALSLTRREDQAGQDLTHQYQSLVARLLYPTSIIRPDLAWHVNFMARFASNPTTEQLSLLKRMLRYYKGTATLGITYKGNLPNASMTNPHHTLSLQGFSDSAFGDNAERKSSAGYVFTMAGGVVSFKSYRQRLVTLSSTEAEYIAITYAAKEAAWIRRLLNQVGYIGNDLKPTALFTDNLPALSMVSKDGHHERTKHIDNYYKYAKQEQKDGNILLQHIPGSQMPADGLTKPLEKLDHAEFIRLINMAHIPRM